MRWFKRNWMLVVFAVINLAVVATPAEALKYKDDLCEPSGGGTPVECCTTCFFFCECGLLE